MRLASLRRYVRLGAYGVAALLAAVLVGVLVADLGPSVRELAEREGSKAMKRRLSIGDLSIRLGTGRIVVEELEIAGLDPAGEPFLAADRIDVSMAWGALLRKEVFVESLEMTGWTMLIETFPGGKNNLPSFGSGGAREQSADRWVTTVNRVRASDGQFTYRDNGAPWSTVARNLDITVLKAPDYTGHASFHGGTVRIRDFEPMAAALETTFTIDGPLLHLDHIDLQTDGADTQLVGEVDVSRWPEQRYELTSRVHFPTMRQLFFADDDFELSGEGDFEGTFHIFDGGRDLEGRFASDVAGIDDLRFSDLRGSLIWSRHHFEVTEALAGFYGGTTRMTYAITPIERETPAVATFDAVYEDVDLAALGESSAAVPALRATATGHNLLEWPIGRFADLRGHGRLTLDPASPTLSSGGLTAARRRTAESLERAAGPFDEPQTLDGLALDGELEYAYGPEWVEVERGWFSTARTHVAFDGRTAYGERSEIPFQVTSLDWQESDRLLAGTITALGTPTRAIPVGGHGEFDGVMRGAFMRPRIEGSFSSGAMHAWDVEWGAVAGDVVIENAYAEVRDTLITKGTSEIEVDGRFSIGYPRSDGGDEIDARFTVRDRPLVDLRHAFGLDRYSVDGTLTGEYHLYGRYRRPFGFGSMTLNDVVAYGEPLESASAGLRLEGEGVRFDAVEIVKGRGVVTGAAFVGFDGTYSFNADGRRIPVEDVEAAQFANAPLSGLLRFTASGSGTFEAPRYDVRGSIDDLFVYDEGVGQVTGRIGVRDELMIFEVNAASPRLAVTGSGQVSLTPDADAELTFRFSDTSLDPYLRLALPGLSPFTTVVVGGTVRAVGSLNDQEHLLVDGTLEQVEMDLFDYQVVNEGPIRLVADQGVVQIAQLRLTGEGTELNLSGTVDLDGTDVAVRAAGDANLGILQGFFPDVRSNGDATLAAEIQGSVEEPRITGTATVADGRLRHFDLPHSLDAINGRVTFDENGIRMDELEGRVAGGDVQFGGWIGLDGYVPGELSLTARGEAMQLRYPDGVRSVVDADLALRGPSTEPLLSGEVRVRSAVWTQRFDPAGTSLFDLLGGGESDVVLPDETSLPVRFDVRILAPSTLQIQNNDTRIVASAELTLRGTYDRPLLFGRAEIDRGEVLFEGHRYVVTRGSIDFSNPSRIEPFFDVEAETRVRVPGETYRVVFRAVGTPDRFVPDLTSDPPLPTVDVLALLFGDPRDPRNADLRALSSPDLAEQELLQARAARLLASPISAGVGRVVEETFGVDSVQISPSLSDPATQQAASLNPSARLTIGKRISDRVYLTFSRALAASTSDQIILLEYDQNERLAWILSQNEDRSYALDFRVRHIF